MIRLLRREEYPAALRLVRQVFDEYVAPTFLPAGIRKFYEFLEQQESAAGGVPQQFYGYFCGAEPAGVLLLREAHIALLYVSAEQQRQGVARALLETARQEAEALDASCLTVNASHFGAPAYARMGFVPTGPEQEKDGMVFTPMRCPLRAQFLLRPWGMEDVPALARYANNANVAKYLRNGFPHPYTEEDARQFLRSCLDAGEERQLMRAIEVDGEPVGSIGIFRGTDVYEKSAEIGYWLAEPYWGRGIMHHAVRQICELAFQQYDIVRIHAEVFSENAASCRVLERAGFSFEGVKRSSIYKNGRIMDSHVFALVREKFRPPVRRLDASIEFGDGRMDEVRTLFEEYFDTLDIVAFFEDIYQEMASLPGPYAPPEGALFVARCRGEAVGCVALKSLAGGRCELKRLYVRAEYRGMHLGRRLCERVIEHARASGYTQMLLSTLDIVQDSISLFHKLGFSETVPLGGPNAQPGLVYMSLGLE